MAPVLGYWSIRGLANPLRMMLKYSGAEFEDKRYDVTPGPEFSREAWTKEKFTLGLDFPNLPYYIDGDLKLTQTGSIIRHIARKHGLIGKTEEEMVRADMVFEQLNDFGMAFAILCYRNFSEENRAKYLETLPTSLELFEKFLGDNDWVAGKNITFADFKLYELMDQQRLFSEGCLEKFPKLTAFLDRFEALPAIKEYQQSKEYIKRPCNNIMAGWF